MRFSKIIMLFCSSIAFAQNDVCKVSKKLHSQAECCGEDYQHNDIFETNLLVLSYIVDGLSNNTISGSSDQRSNVSVNLLDVMAAYIEDWEPFDTLGMRKCGHTTYGVVPACPGASQACEYCKDRWVCVADCDKFKKMVEKEGWCKNGLVPQVEDTIYD